MPQRIGAANQRPYQLRTWMFGCCREITGMCANPRAPSLVRPHMSQDGSLVPIGSTSFSADDGNGCDSVGSNYLSQSVEDLPRFVGLRPSVIAPTAVRCESERKRVEYNYALSDTCADIRHDHQRRSRTCCRALWRSLVIPNSRLHCGQPESATTVQPQIL